MKWVADNILCCYANTLKSPTFTSYKNKFETNKLETVSTDDTKHKYFQTERENVPALSSIEILKTSHSSFFKP